MDSRDIIALTALFLLAFSVWTAPIQQSALPFGEGDSAWHFSIGDYMGQNDELIWRLPVYISHWYYGFNSILGPGALEYTPANHVNYALMQVATGERVVPVSLYRAVASFLGVFAVYFLMRRLYGFSFALLSSFPLVYSLREIMIYLWGQQPTLVSVVVTPVYLYALYRYTVSVFEKKPQQRYLVLAALLLGVQYLLHVQGLIVSGFTTIAFLLFMLLAKRRLPLSRALAVQLALAAAILALIALPFIAIYLGAPDDTGEPGRDLSRLAQWTVPHAPVAGSFPASFVTFTGEYQSLLAIPFILLGIIVLLLRRAPRDLLMLAWLVGVYLTLHLDFLLGAPNYIGRVARMGIAEPALFFSLIAIGVLAVPSLLRLAKKTQALSRYALAAAGILVWFSLLAAPATQSLEGAYGSIMRITPEQVAAADWLNENTAPESLVYSVGTLTYPKSRWMLALSQRHVTPFSGSLEPSEIWVGSPVYVLFDYSDLSLLASNPQYQQTAIAQAQQVASLEQGVFGNHTPLYETQTMKVYQLYENYQPQES